MRFRSKKLLQLRLFYKNDLPEGFGVILPIDNPVLERHFTNASQLSIDEYKKQATDKERRKFIADAQEQFAQCCQWMNQHKEHLMDDEEGAVYFAVLLDNMTFLQSRGLFPDDEYNGPQWLYEFEPES
jgi:hypothetical protein